MYGSSLMCVTRRPRASISAPIEAAPRPLPIEETTPPVTKTNLVRLLMNRRSGPAWAHHFRAALGGFVRTLSGYFARLGQTRSPNASGVWGCITPLDESDAPS